MSRRNRRQFHEDSMLAVAGAAASSSGPYLFAQDEQSSSPNERLQVAVVGANGRGNSHIGAFANGPGRKDTVITTIVDVDSKVGNKRADEIEKTQDGVRPTLVEDLRQALPPKRLHILPTP